MSENSAIVPINTSISRVPMQSGEQISDAWRLAQYAAQSSLSKTKNAYDVMFIIQYGYELGLSAMASVRTIHVINGTPSCSGEAMLALIRRSKLASEITITGDAKAAKCRMARKDTGEVYEATFTIEEANAAGLTNKENWRKFPAKMLKWRCVSECGKFLFSDVIGGLYTIEEMNPNIRVNESGDIIDGDVVSNESPSNVTPFPNVVEHEISKPSETPVTKAWHENVEELKRVLGHCRDNGWIQGDTIGKLKESFQSLMKKAITEFESAQAAIDATDAEIKTMLNNSETTVTEGEIQEAWDSFDGVQAVVSWAKEQGFGDNEPALLRLLAIPDWKAFDNMQQACEEIEKAFKAKNQGSSSTPTNDKLSELEISHIEDWAAINFNISASALADKIDLSKFQTEAMAKKMIIAKAKSETWKVISEKVTHVSKTNAQGKPVKYLGFETVIGEIRFYKSRKDFSALIGDTFAEAIEAGKTEETDPILLTWKAHTGSDGKETYLEATDAVIIQPELAF